MGRGYKYFHMRLSQNFTLAEFTKSQTATRKGLDNTPGAEHPLNIMKKQMTTRINIMPGGGV